MFGGRGRPWPREREVASDKQTVLRTFAASSDEVVGGMKSELVPTEQSQTYPICSSQSTKKSREPKPPAG